MNKYTQVRCLLMRKTRVKKYKKNNKLMLIAQIVAIGYGLTVSIAYITTNTSASFTSSKQDSTAIQAGTWWDGSDLAFIKNNTVNDKACAPTDISVQIKNNGFTMIDSTTYEVYFHDNGNPKQQGKQIATGDIGPIGSDKTVSIMFTAEQNGSYMFKAYQRPEYAGNGSGEIWSEKVMVKCIEEEVTKEVVEDKNKNNQENDQRDSNKDGAPAGKEEPIEEPKSEKPVDKEPTGKEVMQNNEQNNKEKQDEEAAVTETIVGNTEEETEEESSSQ